MKIVFLKTMIISVSVLACDAQTKSRTVVKECQKLIIKPKPFLKQQNTPDFKNSDYHAIKKVICFKYLKKGILSPCQPADEMQVAEVKKPDELSLFQP